MYFENWQGHQPHQDDMNSKSECIQLTRAADLRLQPEFLIKNCNHLLKRLIDQKLHQTKTRYIPGEALRYRTLR